MDLEVLKSAEAVGIKIGNPVPYNEGKIPFKDHNPQLNASYRCRILPFGFSLSC
jgi:hypothetical protein